MGFSSTFQNDLLKLIFNASPIANVADNAAASPLTNIYLALHTANPGTTPAQTTSEAAYSGYARVTEPRTSGSWTVTGNSVSNTTEISFPIATGGSETEQYASVGQAASGAGKIIISGALSPTIVVASGVTPVLTLASAITIS
jgi:hypothetical protein